MKRINHLLDPHGNPVNGLDVSDTVDARVLAAGVAEVHTISTGAKNVRFTCTTPIYVNFGAAAAVPGADVTDGSSSILVLTDRIFSIPSGDTTIGIIAPANSVATLEFFS